MYPKLDWEGKARKTQTVSFFFLNRFTMAAVLNDIEFESVTGKNKNQTKNRATAAALRQLLETGEYELPSTQVIVSGLQDKQTLK